MRPWLVCVTTRPGAAPIASTRRARHADRAGAADREGGGAARHRSRRAVRALRGRRGGARGAIRRQPALRPRARVRRPSTAPARELPETVESLLTTRIDTLEPADRMLLRYASVVGPTFELDLLGEILADEIPEAGHPERWGPLSEFIVPADGDALAFRHDLVRATAYEGLSFRRRRQIHGRVGHALEQRAGDDAGERRPCSRSTSSRPASTSRRGATPSSPASAPRRASRTSSPRELFERALAAAAHLDDVDAASRSACTRPSATSASASPDTNERSARMRQRESARCGDPVLTRG